MKQTKFLLLLLLALVMSATGAFGQTVGTRFTVDNVTYQITVKDLATPANNTVAIYEIAGSGVRTIPETVTNEQDHESYKVTSVIPWVRNQIKPGVTEIVFPETLTSIPEGSFKQCDNPTFTKVTIPASCTSIGTQVFIVNPSFKEFVVAGDNQNYKAVDGVLYSKDGKTLHMCPPGKEGDLVIPEGVTKVESWGIGQGTKLDKISIPSTLTEFVESSFVCSGKEYVVADGNPVLSTIDEGVLCNKAKDAIISYPHHHKGNAYTHPYTIPNGIKTINSMAFYVSNVSVLNLNQVETIQPSAFQYSYGLTTLNIGPSVKTIGESAFAGCSKLATITVDANNPYYKAEADVLFNKAGDHLMLCATKKSGDYTVPAGVKYIDSHAFLSTTDLNSVTISKDVEEIGEDAFSDSNVKAINFESGSQLKTIRREAFARANSLTEITIPASVTTIAPQAFYSMDALKTVTFESGSQLEEFTGKSFSNNKNLENVVFAGSSNLKTIQQEAFSHDPKLKSFEVPASVTDIKQSAFLDTPSMTTVTFKEPASISTIGQGAFAYSGITAINLPESVTKIEQQAFDNCKGLTTVNIPANLNQIDRGAFNMCDEMLAFTVDAGNMKYKAFDGMLCNYDKTELVAFPAGKADTKYTLIPNIQSVAPYAFYGSKKVTNITFPKTVTSIGTHAIALCDNLKSLSFMGEDGVPTLNADIMYESGNLKNVTIFVRKKWYESSANDAAVANYNATFKEVHPSFVSQAGYDRGTEFFPTSVDNVGVIGFYTPRTSVIIDKTALEPHYTDARGKTWPAHTYTVSTVLDYAYQNEATVKDIVILADIGVIGLDAFKAGSQLQGLYFVGTTPALLNSVDYEMDAQYPFNDGQTIYVRPSVVSDYKTVWEVDNHTLGITSKIPQQTNNGGATRCYPFDTQYDNSGDVRPYLPVDFTHTNKPTNPYAKARRIDDGYVPRFLGVLLHSVDAASATSYCEMTDAQDNHAVTDPSGMYNASTYKMVGVVEDTQVSSTAANNCYAFSKSKGKFLKIKTEPQHNTMPYFSAYLKLSASNQAKEFRFVFDDSETTGIDGISTEAAGEADNAPYYNLSGQRVEHPQHGVYIHNGKKVIIK